MAAADNVPDLSRFLGSPDDECPLCFEAMPPLTRTPQLQEKRRCGFPCCGNFMCSDCAIRWKNHVTERYDEWQIARSTRGQREVTTAKQNYDQACKCPLCRARQPSTQEEVFQYELKNAKKGRAHAQYELALSYIHGCGTQKNLVEAARWFKAAAEQGHPWAIDQYGQCLQYGEGATKNL